MTDPIEVYFLDTNGNEVDIKLRDDKLNELIDSLEFEMKDGTFTSINKQTMTLSREIVNNGAINVRGMIPPHSNYTMRLRFTRC